MIRAPLRLVANALGWLAANMPGSSRLIQAAAVAPVRFKTAFFEAVMSRIAWMQASAIEDHALVETNCGIADYLRLEIPHKKYDLIFGSAFNCIGERATLSLSMILCQRSEVFLDIGANEGIFALAIATMPNAPRSIHLFEPDSAVFCRVKANLERNNLPIMANCKAVGAQTGTAQFQRNLTSDYSGSLTGYFAATNKTEAIYVPIVTLADYLEEYDLQHVGVKIDVEGAGDQVWAGARTALDRIDWIIIEMITPEWDVNLPFRMIEESGWNAYYIRDFELRQWCGGPYDYLAPCYNWLYCRESPDRLAALLAGSRFSVTETNAGS